METHKHPWPFEHVSYPDAGHVIVPPFELTTATTVVHPVTRRVYAVGSTIDANVSYRKRTLEFLPKRQDAPIGPS